MTDFFRSLDRALDEEHPYAWTPPADTSFVEMTNAFDGGATEHLLDLQDRINAAIIRQDESTVTFRVNPNPPPRGTRWYDLAPDELEPVAYDGFGAPLYAHQIPAEGTE